jgi:hypothetical protein
MIPVQDIHEALWGAGMNHDWSNWELWNRLTDLGAR